MNNAQFSINGRKIGEDESPYIIAEVSANHNGSLQRAKDTIKAAQDAGVDAVKIQTYTPDTMTIDAPGHDFKVQSGLWENRTLFDLYSEAYTPFEWHEELFSYAKQLGITLFSSPFDETAVDLLESLDAPAYKIASFEIVDLPLIAYIAKLGKPMLMSTGMATPEEIREALDCAKKNGCNQVALFHCISSYPAPLEVANVKAMAFLRQEFNVEVGLSDHTTGNTASIVATSLGATVIEKHFTLSRKEGGVDSAFSLEPQEMQKLVEDTRAAHSALGSGTLHRTEQELGNRIFRRSLYFVQDVEAGEKITNKHVRRIRPGFGLAPKYYHDVIGSICKRGATRGERVTLEHF